MLHIQRTKRGKMVVTCSDYVYIHSRPQSLPWIAAIKSVAPLLGSSQGKAGGGRRGEQMTRIAKGSVVSGKKV